MADRLDALIGRKYMSNGEEKTAWTKIGVAFPTKNGGYSVQLEAVPAPQDGAFKFVLFVPKPKERTAGEDDGEIPY
jgi:hypothetical protein